MARAPFQVVVFPFRRRAIGFEYAVLQRSDNGAWQGVAGGGEDNETPTEAARRESEEEAAIPKSAPVYRLQAMSTVPIVYIGESARAHWSKDLYVIPNYAFAVDCTALELRLSHEHDNIKWLPYNEAYALLYWQNDKVALWELNERFMQGQLPSGE
ncbi:MAG TPA: NUDIX domain-containing protein [Kofleriaceae bacterium]|jgi:dATP pyrophosphohydrolase